MKKKAFLYKKIEAKGEKTAFSSPNFIGEYQLIGTPELAMCPYTEFIPLAYLLSNKYVYRNGNIGTTLRQRWGIKQGSLKKEQKFNDKWRSSFISTFTLANTSRTKKETKEWVFSEIRDWLEQDRIKTLDILKNNGYRINYRDDMLEQFKNNDAGIFYQRSYSGAFSPYSLYLKTPAPDGINIYTPHVLAVILPENYLYVKYHLMVYGTIPCDKVIILVDKKLDETSFTPRGFRTLYKELMPNILETSCDVWKVPHEFIIDRCFMSDYKLKEKNIFKRKQEQDNLIEEFYKTFNTASSDKKEEEVCSSDSPVEYTINGPATHVELTPASFEFNSPLYTVGVDPAQTEALVGWYTSSIVTEREELPT